ncbi:metallophosphoesterase [Streptomyces sp. JJ66]|uniref:metallophosphoesterase family protein n=1 Tax=Streptomyces sp. JJ66 TaxID=2803843 RepID=UPI001C5A0623|nr:metallophosphoesterase [Streptomyces sp. JJ66]MBW1601165.1 metallophosphoesterase [Streptomyces sp. JJ66]
MPDGKLWAISDLHIAYAENRTIVEGLHPASGDDWLIVAGDVAERSRDIAWALRLLASRFARVIWAPGNHELWTPKDDPLQLRGEARYRHLVEQCRTWGVLTPEDPYPVWEGAGGPARIAPLFLLYDYTWRHGDVTQEEALAHAYDTGVVCSDEFLLHPDPYPSREAWCRARVAATEERLRACDDADVPLVLVNHYPLVREPTRILHYPQFAQWCGTELTADWHRRFHSAAMVYGHLHIPRSTVYDGVPFEEVSVGYPREWKRPRHPRVGLRQILPAPGPRARW